MRSRYSTLVREYLSVNLMDGWRLLSRSSSFWMEDSEPMKMKKRSSMKRLRKKTFGKPDMMQSRKKRKRLAYGGAMRHPIAVPAICR